MLVLYRSQEATALEENKVQVAYKSVKVQLYAIWWKVHVTWIGSCPSTIVRVALHPQVTRRTAILCADSRRSSLSQ
jgi:hypothetical protein